MPQVSKIYVASSWRNEHQPEVVLGLRRAGYHVYDFRRRGFSWEDIDPDWSTWDLDQFVAGLDDPIAIDGFNRDYQAMLWADACVVVMPCGRSAHLEAGFFCGKGRECFFYYPPGVIVKPELMTSLADGITGEFTELLRFLGGPEFLGPIGLDA